MDSKKKTNKTRCRACPASGFCSDVCYNRDVPDVTCAHAVKYDKLNKRVASLEGQMETVKFMPLKQRDVELEKLWDEFADVPMNPDTEKMEGAFLHFPAGTPRETSGTGSTNAIPKASLRCFTVVVRTTPLPSLLWPIGTSCAASATLSCAPLRMLPVFAALRSLPAPRRVSTRMAATISAASAMRAARPASRARILRLDGIWSSRTAPTSETLRFTAAPSTKMKISIPRKTRITGTIPAVLFCSLTGISRLSMSCGKR